MYGLTLIWSFFGIAIISDIFMSAIEVITSLEREVKTRGNDGTELTLYASRNSCHVPRHRRRVVLMWLGLSFVAPFSQRWCQFPSGLPGRLIVCSF